MKIHTSTFPALIFAIQILLLGNCTANQLPNEQDDDVSGGGDGDDMEYVLERFTAIFEKENGSLYVNENDFYSPHSMDDQGEPKKFFLLCHKPTEEEKAVMAAARNFENLNPPTTPAVPHHPCFRECSADPKTWMTCVYKFVLEHRMIMSPSDCGRCPLEPMDCLKRDCITADGVRRIIDTVNRQLPGPSIRVCEGDTVVVDVVNEVREETSIHWHGIHMRKTPWMDGVPRVTQCPIPRDRSFRYEFDTPIAGTYFWHSHAGFQRGDGVFGSLIVRKPIDMEVHGPLAGKLYDFDLPEHEMIVMDWQKRETMNVLLSLQFAGDDFRPNNALINGKGLPHGFFNATKNPEKMVPLHEVRIREGFGYRFRLISNGIMSCPLEMSIENHQMTVIASDGFDLEPVTVDSLVLYAGERWDVIIRGSQPIGSYWIKFRGLNVCASRQARVYQLAVLNYEGIPVGTLPKNFIRNWTQAAPPANGLQLNPVNNGSAEGRMTVTQLSSVVDDDPEIVTREKADQQFYLSYDFNPVENLLFTQGRSPGHVANVNGRLYIPQVNQISHFPPSSPPLTQPETIPYMNLCSRDQTNGKFVALNSLNDGGGGGADRNCSAEFCACAHMLRVTLGSIVEIVLVDQGTTLQANHPWHLHGHSFRVIAMDRVNRSTTPEQIQELDEKNLISRRRSNAPVKDTVTVPAGGYTILRFRANNAGFWFFHCHVEFHVEVGMGLIIQIGEVSEMLKPPENFPKCGTHQTRQYSTPKPSMEETTTPSSPVSESESCKTGRVMKLLANRGLSPLQTYNEMTFQNYRHILVRKPMLSWDDASEACQSLCGELASVRTTVDLANVKQTLSDVTWAWLGGRRSEDGVSFQWTGSKEQVPAFFWGHGEPNNAGGREDCTNIFKGWSGGNDYTCSRKIPFICQLPLQPPVIAPEGPKEIQKRWTFFYALLGTSGNIPDTLLTNYKPTGAEIVVSVTNFCGRNQPLRLTCATNEESVGPFFLNDRDGIVFRFYEGRKIFWCDVQWYDRWQVFSVFDQNQPQQNNGSVVSDFRIYGNIIGNKGGVYVGTTLWKLWA